MVMNGIVDDALFNGTISVGKPLNDIQRLFIIEQTGDENAPTKVNNDGFWLDATIESEVDEGVTNFSISYTLIYAKDDVVRSVDGTHTLI